MARRLGYLVLGCGLAMLSWVAVTVVHGDPMTSLYTRYEQRSLDGRLDAVESAWQASRRQQATSAARLANVRSDDIPRRRISPREALKREARTFSRTLRESDALGRLVIPRIGLKIIIVEGTTRSTLKAGPGHYNARSGQATGLPGMGRNIGIAGHRTTYLHPFRDIDDLRPGHKIYVLMPYGTFRYTVVRTRIVRANDWSPLRKHSTEMLVLSACHPLYSASHRWIVLARLTHSPGDRP